MTIVKHYGKLYRMAIDKNGRMNLISKEKDDGFQEYVDVVGEISHDLFIKKVGEEELEDAYALSYKAYYKGEKFDTESVEDLWNEGDIALDTEDIDLAKKYEFKALDRSWFYKRVKAEEIEALIEYKVPILQFKNTKQMTSRKIPKEEIMDYAKYMASFA